jgi:ElaA protein
MILRSARFADLDAGTLYALLRLRVAVFVVEQHCPYPELDGLDLEPGTRHLWLSDRGACVAYLRVLQEGDSARIGRVCTDAAHRGAGLSGRLLAAALDLVGDRLCVLNAQSYLTGYYERFGFAATGPEFVEDGIPHVPMARLPGATATATPKRSPRPSGAAR